MNYPSDFIGKVVNMDCIEAMKGIPDNSIDSIVTDPPYGLGFMNKKWDTYDPTVNRGSFKVGTGTHPQGYVAIDKPAFQEFCFEWAKEALRVLKPGGHLLSFGGTRTYHRMACAIENAGFEIRDQIMWVYGSGFPKSLNIGKAVDKMQGNEREDLGKHPTINGKGDHFAFCANYNGARLTKGTSAWEGYGTALKPSHEPIVLARKPLSEKTVALNVIKWGVGGINIDGCRVDAKQGEYDIRHYTNEDCFQNKTPKKSKFQVKPQPIGRFPANLIHDGSQEVLELFPNTKSNGKYNKIGDWKNTGDGKIRTWDIGYDKLNKYAGEEGSAARFFYCAKASKSERNMGCEGLENHKPCYESHRPNYENTKGIETPYAGTGRGGGDLRNNHPTVKPIKLMEYLVKLITPPNGIVLDPFGGSGSTGCACIRQGRPFILIEKEPEYVEIARKRLLYTEKPLF